MGAIMEGFEEVFKDFAVRNMQKHENHPVRDVFLDLLTLEDGTDMSS
jgi:hypothetical protein